MSDCNHEACEADFNRLNARVHELRADLDAANELYQTAIQLLVEKQARIDKALALSDEWDREGESSEWIAALLWGAHEIRAALAADTPTTATAEGSDQ